MATDENTQLDDTEQKVTMDENEEANTIVNTMKDEVLKPMTIVQCSFCCKHSY